MNVYIVVGGWDWEGTDSESVRVFTHRELAEDYSKELTMEGEGGYRRYDHAEILERPLWSIVEEK
jgi:hypothetical protein